MKLIKLLLPVTLLLAVPACQTAPLPEPLDVTALQDKAVSEAKAEWCRGQEPLQAIDPLTGQGITLDELLSAPGWVQGYVNANNVQWDTQCAE